MSPGRHPLLPLGLVLGLVQGWGCGPAPDAAGVAVDTLANGRVVVSSPAPSVDSWLLTEDVRLGVREGSEKETFGHITAVATDTAARIHVADHRTKEIRSFGPEGTYLGSWGREGEGPGEFGYLSGMSRAPNGMLWVMDPLIGRLTVLDEALRLVTTYDRSGSPRFATIPWLGKFDGLGRLYDVRSVPSTSRDEARDRVLVRYELAADYGVFPLDTLPLPPTSASTYTYERGGMHVRTSVPFSPSRLHAIAPDGDVWYVGTEEYRLHRLSFRGDTLRTVELRESPPRVSERERDSVEAVTSLGSQDVPEVKPRIRYLTTDSDGRVWVQLEPRSPGETSWDLFEGDGRYLGRIRSDVGFDSEICPPVVHGDTVIGVVEDELGVQYVVRAVLEPLTGTASSRSPSPS